MRPIWKGALSFGLVNIPIQLYSAIQAGERVSFRLLHRTDHSPIRYDRVCQKDGKSVPWDDIVKGYEYAKGRFVEMPDDESVSALMLTSAMGGNLRIETMRAYTAEEMQRILQKVP